MKRAPAGALLCLCGEPLRTAARACGPGIIRDMPSFEFDAAVTMGCGDACPNLRARRREDWAIPDPKHLPPAEFARVRDLIESKVKQLISEI